MVNVSSLPKEAHTLFDLDSSAGVMHLLASVRASEIGPTEKNELRDLIFLYTNGGREQTVRRALEQKLAQQKLAPVARKQKQAPLPPPPQIGKYRATPTFSVSRPVTTTIPQPEPAFTASPAWKPEPAPVVVAEPVEEVVIIPEPIPTPAVPTAPPIPEPVPVVVTAPTVAVGDTEAYLLRIREIKALVNEKVGNPVNLVDINNEVGREYMASLLDAMKKINSGTSAASAMKRLETAYVVVEETLRDRVSHATSEPVSAPRSVPIQSAPPAPAEEVPWSPPPAPVSAVEDVPEPGPFASLLNDVPAASPITTPVPLYEPLETTAASIPSIAHVSSNVTPVMPLGQAAEVPTRPEQYFSSLADYDQKPASGPVTSVTSLKAAVTANDPLFTHEVDEGLEQLLIEWSLFKKSGLFGTGPKGKDHPLFKKMAPLQIPLLLAGRFEGATQDIKQSVTDYMNGWRYEQGLIYQQGETFEHYLRRVIRHILDLQKAKSS